MIKLLCVCIFLAETVNSYRYLGPQTSPTLNPNDADTRRKMFSYFEQSAWASGEDQEQTRGGFQFQSPINIIQGPTIERTYRTEIQIKQISHPYLFRIMQMIPIKVHISFQYIYQKLFKFFTALQYFKPNYQELNQGIVIQILQFVFPELKEKIYEIAKYPIGPPMLKVLFEIIFPQISRQDMNLIFYNAGTIQELIVNLILYLCPNIQEHFLWKNDSPTNQKLSSIFSILFPGIPNIFNPNNFPQSMQTFLEMLFQGKLTVNTNIPLKPEGPEWSNFQKVLYQYNINYETLPKDVLYYLFSNYKNPEFNMYLIQMKDKMEKQNTPNKMDPETLKIWLQYLHDLKTHTKSLNDMPHQIKIFLQQYENPQEFMKIISNSLGFQINPSKLDTPMDPEIMDLWKKFIIDIMKHKGDTTHFPKDLLDYFNSLSQNPNFKSHLDVIFDSLSINPQIAVKWNTFFDHLQKGETTLEEMPKDLTSFLTTQKHPEEFLRVILKLRDSNANTNYLNIDTKPEVLHLWKQFINDVAINKGAVHNIPPELMEYFKKISSNPEHAQYIKLLFSPDKLNPKTLETWNQFITNLKTHQADLQDMPSEIIQLMLKYDNPNEFFKILLPNMSNKTPDDLVKQKWKEWTINLKNRNTSVYDTPDELKNYFQQLSSSSDDYKVTLNQIYSINPILLLKWKNFMLDLKQNTKSMDRMPEDLKKYILEMKSPKNFVNLIFNGLDEPLNEPISTPTINEMDGWEKFLKSLMKPVTEIDVNLSLYLRHASKNIKYKQDLDKIYQMDATFINGMTYFVNEMKNDYNVTLNSLPSNLLPYFYKNGDISDIFRSILATYPGDYYIRDFEEPHALLVWYTSIQDTFIKGKTEITSSLIPIIEYVTKDTPLSKDIQEVFKLHEKNELIKRFERIWWETKENSPIHDGLEVFLQFLDTFGTTYENSAQLCEYKEIIMAAFDKIKNRFGKPSCEFKNNIIN